MDKCTQKQINTTNSIGSSSNKYQRTQWFSIIVKKNGMSVTEIPYSDYRKIENYRNYGFKVASSFSKQNVMYLLPPQLTRSEVNNLICQIERPKSFGSNKITIILTKNLNLNLKVCFRIFLACLEVCKNFLKL